MSTSRPTTDSVEWTSAMVQRFIFSMPTKSSLRIGRTNVEVERRDDGEYVISYMGSKWVRTDNRADAWVTCLDILNIELEGSSTL